MTVRDLVESKSLEQLKEVYNSNIFNSLEYESNNTRNAETVAGKQQTSNGGLLAESQARIQKGDGNLRETPEQRVLSQEDIDKRNQEDRESLEKFAKEQGKWADDVDTKLEKKYGSRIGHGSEAWVYRKDKASITKKPIQTSSDDGSSQYQEWSEIKRNSATGRISFVDGDGKTISTSEDWNEIELFTTPQGEVYGFEDKDNMYIPLGVLFKPYIFSILLLTSCPIRS